MHTGCKLPGEPAEPALLHFGPGAALAVCQPALAVDAVGADKAQPPRVDQKAQRTHKAPVLPVIEAAALAAERKAHRAGVAVDLEFHLPFEKIAVLFIILYVHAFTHAPLPALSFSIAKAKAAFKGFGRT